MVVPEKIFLQGPIFLTVFTERKRRGSVVLYTAF